MLKKLINSNSEYRPNPHSSGWQIVPDAKYKILHKTLKYMVSQELVDTLTNYISENKSANTKGLMDKYEDDIAIIYVIDNIKTNRSYIGYTTYPLFTFIKFNIYVHSLGKPSIFDNITYRRITDLSFQLLEFINYRGRQDIHKRKEVWETILYDKDAIKQDQTIDIFNTKFYDKRMTVFFDAFTPFITKFKKTISYIYKLENTQDNKIFVGGTNKKPVLESIVKKLIKIGNVIPKDIDINSLKLEILEKYYAKSEMDLMFRIDYYKIIHNSIESGYNKGYCMPESEKLFGPTLGSAAKNRIKRGLFLKINKQLLEKYFKDTTNYKNVYGFVYQIKNKKTKERYISYAHNSTLKEKVLGLYDNALHGNIKHSKILKALVNEPYFNFKYSILVVKEYNDNKINIQDMAEKLITKYDTINNGYNLEKKGLIYPFYLRKKLKSS